MDDRQLWAAWRALTQRQREVFELLCEGSTRMEIAEILGVKVRLVDSDIATVVRALGVDDPDRPRLTSGQRRMELRRRQAHVRALERAAARPQVGRPGPLPLVEDAEPEEAPAEPRALVRIPPIVETDADDGAASPLRRASLLGALLVALLVASALAVRVFPHPGLDPAVQASTTSATIPILAPSPSTGPVPTTTIVPPTSTSYPQSVTARPEQATATTAPTVPPPTVMPGTSSTVVATPSAGPVDLSGKVASDLPGTPLAAGAIVTSVIDQSTKRRDVYAVPPSRRPAPADSGGGQRVVLGHGGPARPAT